MAEPALRQGAPRSLTVISPVYNEAECIGAFYEELRAVLSGLVGRYAASILFVVDRSSDETLPILRGIAAGDPAVRVLALSSRFGHQMSLLAGIDHAESDVVIMLDSDLQHPPQLIPRLLEEYERGNEIVLAVREDTEDIHWAKRWSSRLFYRLVNLLSDVPMRENAADYRLLSRRVADVFRRQIRERNLFLRGLVAWLGFRQAAVPFVVGARPAGRSKYSLGRMVRLGIGGVISFSKRPLQLAIYVGVVLALLAIGHAGYILIAYLTGQGLPSGWATLAILVSGLAGLQLLFLGVLGEYVAAIFDEAKGRPHYLIDERINFGE